MKLTVKKLKELLINYPENLLVLVEGYEGGYSDIGEIKETKVKLNIYKEDYMGPHEETPTAQEPAIILLKASNPNAD